MSAVLHVLRFVGGVLIEALSKLAFQPHDATGEPLAARTGGGGGAASASFFAILWATLRMSLCMVVLAAVARQLGTGYDFYQKAAVVHSRALTTRRNCDKMFPEMRAEMGFACDAADVALREYCVVKAVRDTIQSWDSCLVMPCRDIWVATVLHWYMWLLTGLGILFVVSVAGQRDTVVVARDRRDLRHLDLDLTRRALAESAVVTAPAATASPLPTHVQ